MVGKDFNETTSSTNQSDVIGDQVIPDAATTKPNVLANARKLVESKTRFEPDELQPVQESEQLHSYEISVCHHLTADPTVKSITGHFSPQSRDLHSRDPAGDAQKEVATQLRTAAKALQASLTEPKWVYNKIEPELLLQHPHKHWLLLTCIPCGGSGNVTCSPCGGLGRVTCYSCGGGRTVLCFNCSGSARKSRQVPRQVSHTVYRNGQPFTSYNTVYDTQWYSCPSCSGGRVSCPRCGASGKIMCSNCSGTGKVTCNPCDGSGQVGTAAWVDVQVHPGYTYRLPHETPTDVIGIANKEELHALPSISEHFQFGDAIIQSGTAPEAVIATYQGNFRVVRQEVICEGESAHLVAYGKDLRWWTLDGIIERLLQDDLKALSNAIIESTNEGLFSSKVDHLLDKLKHVAASEINVDIVEAALANKEFTEHKGAVSEEYASNVKHGIQVTLRRIYVRTAKSFAWKTTLATLIVGLGAWAFEGVMWAGISVTAVLLLNFQLHRRSIRKLLTRILATPELVQRAMKVASKGSGGHEAAMLLLLPSVALAIVIGWGLPKQPPFSHNEADQSISTTSGVANSIQRETNSQSVNKPKAVEQTSITTRNADTETDDAKSLNNFHAKQSSNKTQQTHASRKTESSTLNNQTETKLDSHSEVHLHMAEKMLDGGFYPNAINLANQVLAKYPDNARALNISSRAQSEMKRTQGESFDKSPNRLDPLSSLGSPTSAKLDQSIETPLDISERMFNKGNYKIAYELANQVLAKHPDNARALNISSRAQSKM